MASIGAGRAGESAGSTGCAQRFIATASPAHGPRPTARETMDYRWPNRVRSGLLESRQGSIAGRILRSGLCAANQRIQRLASGAIEIIGLAASLKRLRNAERASVPAAH